MAVSTARAGNVIGGGDFAENRILPDCVRAAVRREPIGVRNPLSTRPYQHVLDPLYAYLLLAQRQAEHPALAGAYNVGPDAADCLNTGELASLFCECWGDGLTWECTSKEQPHEAQYLQLDSSKIKQQLGWGPRWHIRDAVRQSVAWYKAYAQGANPGALMEQQIGEFFE